VLCYSKVTDEKNQGNGETMKVSVYCLVYNHENYLRSALEGFVQQKTNFDYEVFVHDDASTDRSKKIIEEYAERFPKIIKPIYQQENQYSKGIKIMGTYILPRMSGEYVAVCEGDDYWTDSLKLQRQVDFLDSHPDYVACVHNTMKKNVRTNAENVMYQHEADVDLVFEDVVQYGSCSYHTSSLMYRIEYAKDRPAFFQKSKGYGDYPLAIYLALSGKIRFLNRIMSVYRVETVSSWTKSNIVNTHKNALGCYSFAEMLEAVNEYTNYEYKHVLEPLVLKNEYLGLFFDGKYSKLRKGPYDQIYKSKPLSYKIKTYVKQYFSGAYRFYRKLIYHNK